MRMDNFVDKNTSHFFITARGAELEIASLEDYRIFTHVSIATANWAW